MVEAGLAELAVTVELIVFAFVGRAEGEQAIENIEGMVDRTGAGVGAKIARAVVEHLPGGEDARPLFVDGHFDIRVGFIVFKQNVIWRAMLFNQIHLKQQRL